MTAEQIDGRKNPDPAEIKKARIRAIVLAAFLVVALIGFMYALITQTALQKQITEQNAQILKLDSALQEANVKLKTAEDKAIRLQNQVKINSAKPQQTKQKVAGRPKKKK
jgi:hypothetical protein